jgi:hypothetical protein
MVIAVAMGSMGFAVVAWFSAILDVLLWVPLVRIFWMIFAGPNRR